MNYYEQLYANKAKYFDDTNSMKDTKVSKLIQEINFVTL